MCVYTYIHTQIYDAGNICCIMQNILLCKNIKNRSKRKMQRRYYITFSSLHSVSFLLSEAKDSQRDNNLIKLVSSLDVAIFDTASGSRSGFTDSKAEESDKLRVLRVYAGAVGCQ